jgi:hypothetical protein
MLVLTLRHGNKKINSLIIYMFCKNCGAKLEEGIKFCGKCGVAVAGHEQATASPTTISSPVKDKNLNGLEGWLALVGFGLLVEPFVLLYTIFSVNLPFLYSDNYQNVAANYPTLANLGVYELIINIAFLAALIYLNILFFKKRKIFPRYFIIYLAANFVLILIDYLIIAGVNPSVDASDLGRAFIASAIWIPYLLKSRRVKATFVL